MIHNREINSKIENIEILKDLVGTYETIAASSMQKIRKSVLKNRAFHIGLNRMFQEVKLAHHKKEQALPAGRMSAKIITPRGALHSDETVYVFLSANTGLYGSIIYRTFELFSKEVKRGKPDEIVIIGRIGRSFFEDSRPGYGFTYFDFPDAEISVEGVRKISEHLRRFGKVIVFHGSFKNIVTQLPSYSTVSGDQLIAEQPPQEINYLFEPSLENLFSFFETEIFASLLEQVFHESHLSKLASRLVLLDNATLNIEKALKAATSQKKRMVHSTFNKKQINAYSGFILWK